MSQTWLVVGRGKNINEGDFNIILNTQLAHIDTCDPLIGANADYMCSFEEFLDNNCQFGVYDVILIDYSTRKHIKLNVNHLFVINRLLKRGGEFIFFNSDVTAIFNTQNKPSNDFIFNIMEHSFVDKHDMINCMTEKNFSHKIKDQYNQNICSTLNEYGFFTSTTNEIPKIFDQKHLPLQIKNDCERARKNNDFLFTIAIAI